MAEPVARRAILRQDEAETDESAEGGAEEADDANHVASLDGCRAMPDEGDEIDGPVSLASPDRTA